MSALGDLDYWFALLGRAVAFGITGAALVVVLIAAWVALTTWCPRFHFGSPRSSIVLRSYGKCQIVTGKDPDAKTKPEPRLIQELELQSWFGVSSRTSANWFFGLMRWHQVPR